MTYPVRNKFPTAALPKLNVELGLARLTISMLTMLKILLMSSRLSLEIFVHRSCLPSTMSSHSDRAASGCEDSRWLNSAFVAARSAFDSELGMRRTRRDRISPIPVPQVSSSVRPSVPSLKQDVDEPGPPNTRISSEELPPLSLMGMM